MNSAKSSNKSFTFPMEGLMTFSTYVFGLVGILVGRFWFGLDWTTVMLLYFPCKGLARGIIDNESMVIGESLFKILLFPPISVLLIDLFPKLASSVNDGFSTTEMSILLSGLISVIAFGIVQLVSHGIVPIFANFRLPANLYGGLVRFLIIVSCVLVTFLVVYGFRLLELAGYVVSLPLRFLITLLLSGCSVCCIWGALHEPILPPENPLRIRRVPPVAPKRVSPPPKRVPTAPPAPEVKKVVREVKPPSVRLKDVAGMEEVKRQIRLRLIDPVQDAAQALKYGIKVGGGLLLYGPPGTGKTYIAKAVAGELGLPFFAITAADVFGRYVGDSEGNIRSIFEEVRKHPLSVVFIDELETLFPKRTEEVHETTRKVISLLLQELDGIEEQKNPILLLGATNVPWMIDEAFMRPGRFDVSVFVGLPDFAARQQMFVAAFAKGSVPYVSQLPTYLAERTESYSGADIKGVMIKIRQTAYERRLRLYTTEFVDEILADTTPSANGDILAAIREWEAKRNRK